MQPMPKQSVLFAGCAVALAAVAGIYLGVSRSMTGAAGLADDGGAIVAPVTPVASAKPILTPTPTMDEADVRRMAREEAQAVLAKSQARKAQDDDDDDTPAAGQLTPVVPIVPLAPIKPPTPLTADTPPIR